MPSRQPTTRKARTGTARSGLAAVCNLAAAAIVLAAVAWAAVNIALVASGGRMFVVAGGSMEPAVPRGSLVVVRALDSAPAVGDAVTVRGGQGTYVTHRVIRLAAVGGEMHVELQGDANDSPDPVLVPATAIIGRVAIIVPHAGRLQLVLARPSGWAIVLGTVVGLWMAAGLLRPTSPRVRHWWAGAESPA